MDPATVLSPTELVITYYLGASFFIISAAIIIRYFFVYFAHGGSKTKYQDNRGVYLLLFLVLSLIVEKCRFFIPQSISAIITIGFIAYAITLHLKWRKFDILPDPFQSAMNTSEPASNGLEKSEPDDEKQDVNKSDQGQI